ncbi:uncharacterized protein LOC124912381 [Impatiens glandulifera]|uniref:uncharacterized protein LOC124912381 n=1 Tax=Impatiens glandulifera TaxID=253017 RepID=UPI001FB06AAF|nr:uncharacterized protein LOC124912381 [Impatiens glandulifera]
MGRELNVLIQSIEKEDSCSKPISLETPVTPDSIREMMLLSSSSEVDNNGGTGSPRTPKDTQFNPFSPGSENLLNAPMRKKHCEDSHGKIFRRLVYGLGKNHKLDLDEAEPESEDERMWVRDLYGDLLEVIAYGQAEEVLAAFPDQFDDGSDASPSTDSSLPVFNGIAETCPAAPRKMDDSLKKSIVMDNSLCKKLEF